MVFPVYWLDDASLLWRRTFTGAIENKLGFRRTVLDPCIYVKHEGEALRGIIVVDVDDSLIMGDDATRAEVRRHLTSVFDFG